MASMDSVADIITIADMLDKVKPEYRQSILRELKTFMLGIDAGIRLKGEKPNETAEETKPRAETGA